MFRSYKADFWLTLLTYKKECAGLKEALRAGKINGSQYEGECACLKGTIANIRKCDIVAIQHNSSDPAELWFLMIRPGMTPDNSEVVKLTMEWLEEFETLLAA